MKRLIDANALIKEIDNYYHNTPFPHPGTTWYRGLELAVGLLLKAPTVDAVEVVRCKDCKFYSPYDKPVEDFDGRCLWYGETDEDEYCSYAERRND